MLSTESVTREVDSILHARQRVLAEGLVIRENSKGLRGRRSRVHYGLSSSI